jgi:hypothetical protein
MLARPPATAGQATFEPDDEDAAADEDEPPEPEPDDEEDDVAAAAGLSAFLSPDGDPPSLPASAEPPESDEPAEPFSADPFSTLSFLAPARESVR